MEVQYFTKALSSVMRPPRNDLLETSKTMLLQRIDQLATAVAPAERELDTWCDTIQGGSMGGRAAMVSGFLASDLIKATRMNIASFKT